MNKLRYLMLLLALLLPLALPGPVAVAKPLPELPLELEGVLNGAAYRIAVPANWNGTLLLFAVKRQLEDFVGHSQVRPGARAAKGEQ